MRVLLKFPFLTKFCIVLFVTFASSVLTAEGGTTNPCEFSFKAEIPKNNHFTVQNGRVAFLCKNADFFLRGTVTRTLPWQLTQKVYDTLATDLNAQTIETGAWGRIYRIADVRGKKQLVCAYASRPHFAIDLCAPDLENFGADTLLKKILHEFRQVKESESPFLRSAALSSSKKVFTEKNETQEPALLSLTMPAGYVDIDHHQNRALFTDAAGLAEIEVFYELSDLVLDSDLAHRVYQKAVTNFLAKQGSWKPTSENHVIKNGNATCLLFSDAAKRASNYCYTIATIQVAGKKKSCRVSFIIAYLREAVDEKKLLSDQQRILTEWGESLLKH